MASTGMGGVPQKTMLLLLCNKQALCHMLSWRIEACLCVIACSCVYIYACYRVIYNTKFSLDS